MILSRGRVGGVLLIVLCVAVAILAAPSSTLPQAAVPGLESGSFDIIGPGMPLPEAAVKSDAPRSSAAQVAGANPLWSVPLSALTATRERPLFSSSRRLPAPVMVAAPAG